MPIAEATTGADGRFAIAQVQAGTHQARLTPPAGWHVAGDNPQRFDVIAGWWTNFPFTVAPD
ncbi:MAG: hypothetical protein WBA97_25810 [Actinophytocola sp.]|uniref:hypothetical protein n=1 Tax=Actinophytocola sp. TaxID=1872138 RepID=UPI003C757AC5